MPPFVVCLHAVFHTSDILTNMARTSGDRESLAAIAEFIEFVARSAMSNRQRQRIETASVSPVTGSELAALRAIRRHQPLSVGELALILKLDRTTVSRMAAGLD